MKRDVSINVRFTEKGAAMIDSKKKTVSRGEYIRQAVAYAINKGFEPRVDL